MKLQHIKNTLIRILLIILINFYLQSSLANAALEENYNIFFKNIIPASSIMDMTTIPQNGNVLTSNFSNKQIKTFSKYYSIYFKPWNEAIIFNKEALQKTLSKRPIRFAENYQLIPEEFFITTENNSNLSALGSLNQRGIIINNTNLRTLPVNTYLFGDPREPGEGYPFDYAQDDYLSIGEPLLISHYTKDGRFAYVRTSSGAEGFVLSQDIADVSVSFAKKYQKSLVMLTKNTLGYFQTDKQATLQLYISSVLPIKNTNTLLIPIKNAYGKAIFKSIIVNPKSYIPVPLSFSKDNVIKVVNQLIGQPYGWGGDPYLFHMDCARLVRNYLALFGIYMPLLSKDQSKQGNHSIDLSNMSSSEKKNTIKTLAIPYQSIIYLPGHIGIYMGEYNNEPIMLHSCWGLKIFDETNTEYRYVIGKSIISTLSPGKELVGFSLEKSDLINKIILLANFDA